MKWPNERINKLMELYPNHTNKEIAEILNTNISSIKSNAKKIKLQKDKEFLLSVRKKNAAKKKIYISLFQLIKIAKKYSSRYEFQKYDLLAYRIARRDGLLDKVCSHMVKQGYSCPQLALSYIVKKIITDDIIYNTRMIIKPYEIDIYIPEHKLAFEYDGRPWHQENNNDEIKNKMCENLKIKLIRISEKSRDYITDIKNQLILNIKNINMYTNLNIKEEDVLKIEKGDINDFIKQNIINDKIIKKTINNYKTIGEFKKNEPYLYYKLSKIGALKTYTKNLKRKRVEWNDKLIHKTIKKYVFLIDFIKNENGCYLYINRNNLKFMLNGLKLKISRPITKEEIIRNVLIKKYKNVYEFQKDNGSMYHVP